MGVLTFDDLFRLTPAGPGAWVAPGAPPTDERCVFGGLVVGQAIIAASADTRRCHSLHAYFIGMGAKMQPFEISVEPTRDGGSFSTRQTEVRQEGRLLLAAYSSHHDGNAGPEHQDGMPDVGAPEERESLYARYRRQLEQQGREPRNYLAEQLLDVRGAARKGAGGSVAQEMQAIWFKPRTPIEGGSEIHQAVIAFASDVGLLRAGVEQHANAAGGRLQTASLDHALWFHREASANEWMLHVHHSSVAAHGRGFSRSSIYTREGVLVASATQEFLARLAPPKESRKKE